MKREDYANKVALTPRYCAYFTVVRVPRWAKDFITVGDEVTHVDATTVCGPRGNIALGPSYIKFKEYRRVV